MTTSPQQTILLVCTSHAEFGDTGNKTGFWMEELAAPFYTFKDAGYALQITSIAGGQPPVDPGSLTEQMAGPLGKQFAADDDASSMLAASTKLSNIKDMQDFAGIFLVGGHGTMWDFPDNAVLGDLLADASSRERVIGAVCHGVAGLMAHPSKEFLKGKTVAGFSNAEEAAIGLADAVPFALQTSLVERGANYNEGPAFAPHAVADGLLVTGQNPGSSTMTAELMVKALAV
ncbi:MAG: type 1 glutamine amidotransferase domain-containing protein [Cohaesibacteraceae bacterium]|nr:type 1 glutamine amidotransferase domain-containing protein [Cohaesibacteraceae bacterium]